jgi:hypothetical protein
MIRLQPENMAFRRGKIILGMALAFLLAGSGPVFGQATKTFTGSISEIAKGSEMDINKRDIFYTLRLAEHPGILFRLTPEEAVKSGVIEATGNTVVLTPRMSKGLGWKVKLACEAQYTGGSASPTYRVLAVERLEN